MDPGVASEGFSMADDGVDDWTDERERLDD